MGGKVLLFYFKRLKFYFSRKISKIYIPSNEREIYIAYLKIEF